MTDREKIKELLPKAIAMGEYLLKLMDKMPYSHSDDLNDDCSCDMCKNYRFFKKTIENLKALLSAPEEKDKCPMRKGTGKAPAGEVEKFIKDCQENWPNFNFAICIVHKLDEKLQKALDLLASLEKENNKLKLRCQQIEKLCGRQQV